MKNWNKQKLNHQSDKNKRLNRQTNQKTIPTLRLKSKSKYEMVPEMEHVGTQVSFSRL